MRYDGGAGARQPQCMPKVTVLIVDDTPAFRRTARELLERRGYMVVGEADSAATALALTDMLTPDAVLLDIHLPDADGFEVAAAITAVHGSPAVLLMTADPNLDGYAMVERSGARGLVGKADLARIDLNEFWSNS